MFRIATQMAKARRDVVGASCLKNAQGEVVTDADEIKNVWNTYMEELLNDANDWDQNKT